MHINYDFNKQHMTVGDIERLEYFAEASAHLVGFAKEILKSKQFRGCKFKVVSRHYGLIYADSDLVAKGAIHWDSLEDRYGVTSHYIDSISRRASTKWSKNIKTAVINARKYLHVPDDEVVMNNMLRGKNSDLRKAMHRADDVRHKAFWGVRYMDEKHWNPLFQVMDQVLPLIPCTVTRQRLRDSYDLWLTANELEAESRTMQMWSVLISPKNNEALISRQYTNTPMAKPIRVKLNELESDMVSKLHVLNMLSDSDFVEGVGAKLGEGQFVVVVNRE